ncbi:MAG TPA: imidazolonepropionase [Mycobacteriales bacterium]
MTSTVVTGIGELVTHTDAGVLLDAAVVCADGVVQWIGPASAAPAADRRIDVGGRAVVPGFVDSHTHLVFAGDRSAEFAARSAGKPYDGGGIATTVRATTDAPTDQLDALVAERVAAMRAQGTTTVEIKSGYGLTVDAERRLLDIARQHTTDTTFLGAHVVPSGHDRADYLDLVTGPMLEACASVARWIDVFCEPASAHAFDGDEARAVLTAGAEAGLGLRVHGNQLSSGPGVRLAVEMAAASVDHCTHLTDADVEALAGGTTVATLLPTVEFCTRQPYADARRLLDAGVTVALASDCNPGTSYTSSMPFVIALAVRELHMTPAEALWAATAGGAEALQRSDIGRVAHGLRADLTVVDGPSYLHLAYRPGMATARALDVS